MPNKTLYIVATPIGNLADISHRALEVLRSVDVVLCEDTRQTRKLMEHYGIDAKLRSLHQHSSAAKVAKELDNAVTAAYVSDAGTPGISDPGGKVVAAAVEMGFAVSPIPGASAVMAALSISGFPTDKFAFLGFMPHKKKSKIFVQIRDSETTTCFYESPHRILKTLEQMAEVVESDRQVVVTRELTKKFESVYRGSALEVLEAVRAKPKGEFTVVVAGR